MKKKILMGTLIAGTVLLGGCQKAATDPSADSTIQTSSMAKNSSSSGSTVTSSTSASSSEQLQDSSDHTIATAQKQLIGRKFSLTPVLYDGEDANQAMEENKAPQSLVHDGSAIFSFTNETTVHVELAGTYRPDHNTSYTLTEDALIIGHRNIPYSITNGGISFDTWTTDLDGHRVTWSFSPEAAGSENASDTSVDTKNLTSEQLKAWVGAVLDKQFSLGRHSFPYKLSVENQDGYAYVRVNHSEQQIDTLDMFRINSAGQLEQQDLSNGYPATYKVVSSKFMDTSAVTVMSN